LGDGARAWPTSAHRSNERPPCDSSSLSWSQRVSSPAATPTRQSIPLDSRAAARMIPPAILTIPSATHRTTPGMRAVAASKQRSRPGPSTGWALALAGRDLPVCAHDWPRWMARGIAARGPIKSLANFWSGIFRVGYNDQMCELRANRHGTQEKLWMKRSHVGVY
jgi:hypothetical protein